MDNNVTECAKERIKQIKLIQKDLDNLKNRLKKNECFPKDEIQDQKCLEALQSYGVDN